MSRHLGLFGCYDLDAPRLALLRDAVEALGWRVTACHEPLWPPGEGREAAARQPWKLLPRFAAACARLWRRRGELEGVDAILVPYPGHALMPLARAVANGLGVPLLFDPFLSLAQTIVGDRALVGSAHPAGLLARALDTRALRAADRVLADTPAMAAYYTSRAKLPAGRVAVVPVGADERQFFPTSEPPRTPFMVLFVGHMLPLHGVETILDAAARLASHPRIRFYLVGQGPFDVESRVAGLANVTWTASVPLAHLPALYASAHVILGAFGTSEKAARVVPHKVYQGAAAGRVVVTRDGPAAREAFGGAMVLVPPGDGPALAEALRGLEASLELRSTLAASAHAIFLRRYGREGIGQALVAALAGLSLSSG